MNPDGNTHIKYKMPIKLIDCRHVSWGLATGLFHLSKMMFLEKGAHCVAVVGHNIICRHQGRTNDALQLFFFWWTLLLTAATPFQTDCSCFHGEERQQEVDIKTERGSLPGGLHVQNEAHLICKL